LGVLGLESAPSDGRQRLNDFLALLVFAERLRIDGSNKALAFGSVPMQGLFNMRLFVSCNLQR